MVASSLFLPEMFFAIRVMFPEENLKTGCKTYSFLNVNQLSFEQFTIYTRDDFSYSLVSSVCTISSWKTILNPPSVNLQNYWLITIPMTTAEAGRCFHFNKNKNFFQKYNESSIAFGSCNAFYRAGFYNEHFRLKPWGNRKVCGSKG